MKRAGEEDGWDPLGDVAFDTFDAFGDFGDFDDFGDWPAFDQDDAAGALSLSPPPDEWAFSPSDLQFQPMDIMAAFVDPFERQPYRCAANARALYDHAQAQGLPHSLTPFEYGDRMGRYASSALGYIVLHMANRVGALRTAGAPFRLVDAELGWREAPNTSHPHVPEAEAWPPATAEVGFMRAHPAVFFPIAADVSGRARIHFHAGWNAGDTLLPQTPAGREYGQRGSLVQRAVQHDERPALSALLDQLLDAGLPRGSVRYVRLGGPAVTLPLKCSTVRMRSASEPRMLAAPARSAARAVPLAGQYDAQTGRYAFRDCAGRLVMTADVLLLAAVAAADVLRVRLSVVPYEAHLDRLVDLWQCVDPELLLASGEAFMHPMQALPLWLGEHPEVMHGAATHVRHLRAMFADSLVPRPAHLPGAATLDAVRRSLGGPDVGTGEHWRMGGLALWLQFFVAPSLDAFGALRPYVAEVMAQGDRRRAAVRLRLATEDELHALGGRKTWNFFRAAFRLGSAPRQPRPSKRPRLELALRGVLHTHCGHVVPARLSATAFAVHVAAAALPHVMCRACATGLDANTASDAA